MHAVIKTGGKQYRVSEGDVLNVEKLAGDPGARVELSEVLAVGEGESIKLGTPTVAGATVVAEILGQGKGKKVIVYKKKRRKGYDKRQGHRQLFTSIKIQEIKG
ncbi:MAG TPA: 50S ribosomal protein L21 [Deltaproteobacteria bacterium]|nr:MAG: 50S ribosomal protein L21 [Deltaproteobacteria bacterium GWA2_55_82]OGQ63376.1 MAG: 50S ribosomal protein L21 [Deltaproteobacteria bacterium RIFCSPLOWO2_02_FULL_55_12]OIJ73210.1 MAG: 50S ribosomal protein L21 [Deltaproteobacteria bacterium GWC2_55_46]HBG45530.1 50S ribosomal protein L21 [Deltaproteobacteria bacterium]HCY10361.1 50S ribosomal protein L21 [Deltaproteobacteria bacterium]